MMNTSFPPLMMEGSIYELSYVAGVFYLLCVKTSAVFGNEAADWKVFSLLYVNVGRKAFFLLCQLGWNM